MKSLFFVALEELRKTHKETDIAPRLLYPRPNKELPNFLAQLMLCVHANKMKQIVGLEVLHTFIKDASCDDLRNYLPVFGDYFGYIW